MADNFDDLQQSYGRCLRGKDFIERFYEIFLASHPAIGPMFAATDFQKQRLALRRGISMAISHAAGGGLVKRGIEQMADVHARSGRTPVDPALYPYWVDSLVKAVAETDPQFTPALERRWREGMSAVIQTFSQRH
ncbi:globin [Arenimonas caeni]|uniref:Globin n=1 Tax=Arenimonas caeni TaxID=2058085 RepID=A0A2P6MCL8_9GAMM|nr:globin [Arenimonas caeni]PRH83699.1 globin [Arenimonas caeni]